MEWHSSTGPRHSPCHTRSPARASLGCVQFTNREKVAQMTTVDGRVDPGVDPGVDVDDELVARARGLIPLLSANTARTDRDRRVPGENLAAP